MIDQHVLSEKSVHPRRQENCPWRSLPCPARFAEFTGKRFTLLWRGIRDGFGTRDFHGRCDGHANTLTFIEDREGNIFGGFTPAHESRVWNGKLASENNFFK
jgi:hypothetical protein